MTTTISPAAILDMDAAQWDAYKAAQDETDRRLIEYLKTKPTTAQLWDKMAEVEPPQWADTHIRSPKRKEPETTLEDGVAALRETLDEGGHETLENLDDISDAADGADDFDPEEECWP